MTDKQIIRLFNEHSERAITETAEKYGKYLYSIAYNILHNDQDSEECVNDAYLKVWNITPLKETENFKAYLGKLTRNLALDRYKYYTREKRGGGQTMLALDELSECVPATNNIEQIISDKELADILNSFLASLSLKKRQIFVRRYWYLSSICEIAKDFDISENNAKVMLLRTRNELKVFLEKAGVEL